MLVNPTRKSEYRVEKWPCTERFESVALFKESLKQKFEELSTCNDIVFGYIEPGHGLKGRQHWITTTDDLKDMYKAYEGRKEVIIWCHPSISDKHKQKIDDESIPSKRAKCAEKNEEAMDEVKDIVLQLQQKHGSHYTAEQYNAWAQLINMKKHGSHDSPPDYPFFQGRKKSISTEVQPTSTSSPSRRIHTRSELLNQLGKISELFDKGNIDKKQYDKLQTDIMKDMDMC